MRLRSLHVTGLRSFEDARFDLDRELTVVFGDNGAGKTTLIQAVAWALSTGLGTAHRIGPSAADLRVRTSVVGAARQRVHEQRAELRIVLEWRDATYELGYAWEQGDAPSPLGDHKRLSKAIRARERAGEPLPLLAYYGAQRAWYDGPIPETAGVPPWSGYDEAMSAGTDLGALRAWWRQQSELARQGNPAPGLQLAEEAIQRFVGDGANPPTWSPELEDVLVDVPRLHGAFALRELSDGYRNLLGLVADLARRAAQLQVTGGAGTSPLDPEGIVCVDEVDLHLHPKWQRTVLPGLRDAFPRVQWIVTTHSPQVLASVRANHEALLLDDAAPRSVFVQGRDSSEILVDAMGALASPEGAELELSRIWELVDEEAFQDALHAVDKLEARWGPLDSRLVELRVACELGLADAQG